MSPFKFRTVLRLEKLSKTTNEAPVCLRITKDRKSTYKTLLHVSPSCWDAKGRDRERGGIPVIQELMGHHDVKVTQIYADTHFPDEMSISPLKIGANVHLQHRDTYYFLKKCVSRKRNPYHVTELPCRHIQNGMKVKHGWSSQR